MTLTYLIADLARAVEQQQAANATIKAAQEESTQRRIANAKPKIERRKQEERERRWAKLDKYFSKNHAITRLQIQGVLGGISMRAATGFIEQEIQRGTLEAVGMAKQAKLYAKVKTLKEAA